MNSGIGAMGPYNHANSVIGRAFGILSQNLQGGSVPGVTYDGSQGSNFSYNCITFAENEEASPWEPYHVQYGYDKDESAVTVSYIWGNVWAEYLREYWQEKLVAMISGLEPGMGCTLVLDPIVAREFVEKGFDSKDKIAEWIHENAKIPRRRYWDHVMLNLIHEVVEAGIEPFAGYWAAGPDELIPVFETNRINIVVAGGETNGHFSIFQGSPMRAKFRTNTGRTRRSRSTPGADAAGYRLRVRQVAVRRDRRGRAVACGGDRLARGIRSYVSGGEQARELGSHPEVRGNTSVLVERKDSFEQRGVRDTADVREDRRDGHRRRPSGGEIAHADSVDLSVSENLLEHRLVLDVDARTLQDAASVCLLTREGLARVDRAPPRRRPARARASR